MTLETTPFVSFQAGERRGRELENTCFSFSEQYLLYLGQHPENENVGFTGPEDNKQKSDSIAKSVYTPL